VNSPTTKSTKTVHMLPSVLVPQKASDGAAST